MGTAGERRSEHVHDHLKIDHGDDGHDKHGDDGHDKDDHDTGAGGVDGVGVGVGVAIGVAGRGNGRSAVRRWVVVGVAGASLVFAALATLTALAIPPFTSADEAQHTSYALDVGGGSLPVIDTPVRALLPGMPGIPADCVVTPEQVRLGLEAARARIARDADASRGPGSAAGFGEGSRGEPRPVESRQPRTTTSAVADRTDPARPTAAGAGAGASAGTVRPPSMALEMASAGGMPACARGPRGVHSNTQLTYTANHPPLFYAIESVPLEAGIHSGHPIAGFRAARLLNVVMGIAALAAVAWLVRELLPTRPDLAVGATAVMGTVGMFINSCGQIYNDGLSLATIIAGLAATVALLRRGPSAPRLFCLAVVVLAAAATRASGLLVAGLLLPAAGIAVALHTGGRWRRLGLGIATVAGGAAGVCAGIGWFYWRNDQLYGDPTASGLIAKMFPISEKPMTVDEILHSRTFAWAIYRGFYGRPRLLADGRDLTDGTKLVLLVLVTGLVLAALRRAARWCAARWPRAARGATGLDGKGDGAATGLLGSWPPGPWLTRPWLRRRAPGVVAWALIVLHVAVVAATLVGYVAAGGAWFARYLLPAVPIGALLLAAALAALPGARRGLPTVAAVAALATAAGVMTARELAFKLPALHLYDTVGRLRSALVLSGVPEPTFTLWTLGLVALLGLALLTVAMWSLSIAAVPTWPVPRSPGRLPHVGRAAVDRKDGAGDVGGRGTREEDRGLADVGLGVAGAP
nr:MULTISPECIES: DUF6541 family protein [Pseudofrankia]